jgi:hypothetical protein
MFNSDAYAPLKQKAGSICELCWLYANVVVGVRENAHVDWHDVAIQRRGFVRTQENIIQKRIESRFVIPSFTRRTGI